uniref:Cyclic GMP-AMP synthase a n=2 Tax=Cyprinodon variegatus TaxID=28743 RepID=A0A3Q2CRK7_CYPVA
MVRACNRKCCSNICSATWFHFSHFFIMSVREKPRKARSPESRLKEMKCAPPVQRRGFNEEKQKTVKAQDEQKSNHAEKKPSVEKATKEKVTRQSTRESIKEQRIPPESSQTKTCSSRSGSVKKPPEDHLKSQLEIKAATKLTKEFKAPSIDATKPKARANAEFQTCSKISAKKEGEEPEKAKIKREPEKKNKKAAEESNNKACAVKPGQRMKGKADLSGDALLRSILSNLKIKTKNKAEAAKVVNEFIENLIKYLKKDTLHFREVDESLRTGSYYENLKISDPDEFDVMLPMPVERVKIEPFGPDGAFYSVGLKRGNNPLKQFQQDDILSASEMLNDFRKEIKTFVKGFPAWTMTPKKQGCPAVTLTAESGSVTISLDVVLCLKVKSSWPDFTRDGFKIDQWLGTKVKQEYKREPYYLVPKYEGRGNVENNGVQAKDAWRVSFSHIEKDIMRKHGSEKTCCEREGESCCRKDCVKLFKHLLHLLKESNPSFEKFCSYHAKTVFLHACCSRAKDSEWRASDLSRCFDQLLQDFEGHLRGGILANFFIPSQNLLSGIGKNVCKNLSDSIKEQRENGFPIFVKDLAN